MQFYLRRPADQWRGFAALDARHSDEHVTRHDSAKHRAARRHQHRSNNVGYANAKHLGMRGEHDDESGNARHHGAGQRHGRCRNAGRIAAGLLREKIPSLRLARDLAPEPLTAPVCRRQDKRAAFGRPFVLVVLPGSVPPSLSEEAEKAKE
ncbi:hypothetical protein [Bradyrhizobium sp.]|jgi:hypothetical protein|uniref:hypothetical protein n=1 Tax=Bradyrhizobium sp. TaxID=376 RepID=UPI003D09A896